MAKKILALFLIAILLNTIVISCQSCPDAEEQILNLPVEEIPEPVLVEIKESLGNGILISYEDYRLMLKSILDYYVVYYKLLLSMEASGQFNKDAILIEKEYCNSVIAWISEQDI